VSEQRDRVVVGQQLQDRLSMAGEPSVVLYGPVLDGGVDVDTDEEAPFGFEPGSKRGH
jgi:hypothetical protein